MSRFARSRSSEDRPSSSWLSGVVSPTQEKSVIFLAALALFSKRKEPLAHPAPPTRSADAAPGPSPARAASLLTRAV